MKEIELFFNNIPSSVIGILITALLGLFAWLSKSLVEGPINSSKDTFYKFITSKIEILSEIKSHLAFIAYFPKEQVSLKEKLQDVLKRDGKTAYIDKDMLASLIHFSITDNSEPNQILKLIESLDKELGLWINKAKEDNQFFIKYYSPSPTKRIFVLASMFFWVSFLMLIIATLFFAIIYFLIVLSWIYKILILSVLIFFFFLTLKQFHK